MNQFPTDSAAFLIHSHALMKKFRKPSTLFHRYRKAPTSAAIARMMSPIGLAVIAALRAHWTAAYAAVAARAMPSAICHAPHTATIAPTADATAKSHVLFRFNHSPNSPIFGTITSSADESLSSIVDATSRIRVIAGAMYPPSFAEKFSACAASVFCVFAVESAVRA